MQFIVISHQLWETALGLLVGAFLGLSYDCVRFLRFLIAGKRTEMLFANLFDILFGIYTGCSYCIFIYYASSGRYRWFTALALVLGFLAYRVSLGRLVIKLASFVSNTVRRILRLLCTPISAAFMLVVHSVQKCTYRTMKRNAIRRTNKYKRQLKKDIILKTG